MAGIQKLRQEQIQVKESVARSRALSAIRSAQLLAKSWKEKGPHCLGLWGKRIGFERLIGLTDEMVANLKNEQIDDSNKKEYCHKQLDLAEDKKKEFETSCSNSEMAIKEMEGEIQKPTEEIAALTKGVKTTRRISGRG